MDALTRMYADHIRRFEKSPIVREVLSNQESFATHVNHFYDLIPFSDSNPVEDLFVGWMPANQDNEDRTPSDLVEILSVFGDEPIDASKLKYGKVREGFLREEERIRRSSRRILPGTAMALVGAFALGAGYQNPVIAIPAGLLAVGGVVLIAKGINHTRINKPSAEYEEFSKLHTAAGRADHFMDFSYRENFMRRMALAQR